MDKKFITLTTDYGYSNFYTGILKGSLFSLIPDCEIIDITHEVPHYNIIIASFILKYSFSVFPDNTIHIVDVNGENSYNNDYLVVKYNKQYFLGADNGLFSLLFENKSCNIFKIKTNAKQLESNFKTKDILVPFAAKIANKTDCHAELEEIDVFSKEAIFQKPFISGDILTCSVIYTDNHNNAILNISKEEFYDFVGESDFTIYIDSHTPIRSIYKGYYDNIVHNDISLVALFGTTHNLLEIALTATNAAGLLGLKLNSKVMIERA